MSKFTPTPPSPMIIPNRSPAPILTGDERRSPSPTTSPRSPNRRSFESDGVGLGIVAALYKPGHGHKLAVVCSPRPIISTAVARAASSADWTDSESYTCVTCRASSAGPPLTTVYYEGAVVSLPQDEPRTGAVFTTFMESPVSSLSEKIGFLSSDFLSCCYLCRSHLHGKDIFMYRGDKAFCSAECRYQQMVSDEYKETCGSELNKASEVVHEPFWASGITAA